jgi:hypothetical protein
MRTSKVSPNSPKKVCLRCALVSAQLVISTHNLRAQPASNANQGNTSWWMIGMAVLVLFALFWAFWRFRAKRMAAREARLAEERRAKEKERLAAERRAQKETWANDLPNRLEAAILDGEARPEEKMLKLVFDGHPDSSLILGWMKRETSWWGPALVEVISDLRGAVATAEVQRKGRAVYALRDIIQRLLRKEEAQRRALEEALLNTFRSGALSQSSS